MDRKAVKTKLISSLLAAAIFLVNFSFLPIQSIVSESSYESSITAYAATTKPGTWIKESNGKWWYKHTDGTYTKNDWEYINGYWYHFDASGWMQTGWLKVDGKWYHLNSEGKMHIGWVKIGNYWYHFDSNGVRQTGWQKLNGNWYYFNSDGIRQVGWQQVDGKWYHLNSEGIMETGWVKIGTDWYFFHSTGERYVGWLPENGKTYHFNSSGIMDTGWKKINDYWYFFNTDGSMQTGWKKIDGSWYYFKSNGIMETLYFVDGTREYDFYPSGKLRKTEINVKKEKQRNSHWCWAASSVMVGAYNTDSTRTQEDVLRYTKGSTLNFYGYPNDEVRAINYVSKKTKSAKHITSLEFEDVVEEIDNNRPFIIRLIRSDKTGGHSVVCAGYDREDEKILIIDPWEGNDPFYYNFSAVKNETSFYGVKALYNSHVAFTYK